MNIRDKRGIRDFRVGDHAKMPLAKENKYARKTAGLGRKVTIYISQMLNIRDW